ncbi:MAG: (d)CMP kinase [Verrucomicrobiae bacterium]|nr:(d)CMP kinase [Verrucomicrobiae bacterium]
MTATARTSRVVAIDGPGAAGKSTVARGVARALGYAYVDTGAMYRTLAWHCLQTGVDVREPRRIAAACRRWKTRLHWMEGEPAEVVLLVDGYRPVGELRSRAVSEAASDVAVVPAVRAWMKRIQRDCAQYGGLVMEGRDIATNVFPETDHKFWLDASAEERARRRRAQGMDDDLGYRDRQDSQRAAAPLMLGLGAVRIDTTGRAPEELVEAIVTAVRSAV